MHKDTISSPTHENFIQVKGLKLSQPGSLVLGVSGHRDILEFIGESNTDENTGEPGPILHQKKLITERLKSQLSYLVNTYKISRITLYSPLADGADDWVHEVCEMFCDESDVEYSLNVIIPIEEMAYIKMADPHSDDLKKRLNEKTTSVPQVCQEAFKITYDQTVTELEQKAIHEKNPKTEEEIKQIAQKKAQNYALRALGDFYAQNCDLMICLWDGVHSHAMGGTADVIYHMRSLAHSKNYKKLRCQGAVNLTVAREKNPYPSHEPLTWHHFPFCNEKKPKSFSKGLHFLKRYRPASLLILAALTLFFGWKGYRVSVANHPVEVTTVTISHLFLGTLDFSNESSPHNNWVLLSRFFGLIFFIYSASALLEHLVLAITRLRCFYVACFSHDLICGLGWRGQALLENQGDDSIKTIAIDIQPDKSAYGICSHCSTPLIVDDARQWDVLKKIGLNNTRQAFICTGSDEINMRVVHQIASQYKSGGCLLRRFISKIPLLKKLLKNSLQHQLVCTVALLSRKNFQALLHSLPQGHQIDLRMFHTETATARMFMRNNHIDRFTCSPKASGARVVIIGDCTMADVLMHQNITQGVFENGKKLEIIRLLSNAKAEAENFIKEHPAYQIEKDITENPKTAKIKLTAKDAIWKNEQVLPDILMHELPKSQRGFVDWTKDHLNSTEWVLTVIVAQENPAVSSATAARLAPVLEGIRATWSVKKERMEHQCDVALWFLFNTPNDAMRASIEHTLDSSEGNKHLHIRAFSDFLGICNRSVATGDEADAIAKRVNIAYWGLDLSPTHDKGTLEYRQTEINNAWESTSVSDKDSSRQCAEHCFLKQRIRNRMTLYDQGSIKVEDTTVENKDDAKNTDKQIPITPGLPEPKVNKLLAPIEHRRWCADHLMQGYEALTKFPSSKLSKKQSDHPTPTDTALIEAWFTGKNDAKTSVKAKRKQELKHVDLIPFKDFDTLFTGLKNNKGKDLATAEKDKDSAIVNHLDDIMRTDEFENI